MGIRTRYRAVPPTDSDGNELDKIIVLSSQNSRNVQALATHCTSPAQLTGIPVDRTAILFICIPIR